MSSPSHAAHLDATPPAECPRLLYWYRLPNEILNGVQKYAFLWPPPIPAGPVERGVQFLEDKYVDVEASGDLARAMFVPRDLVERTGCGTLNISFEQFVNQTDFCNTTVGKFKFACVLCTAIMPTACVACCY